MPVTPPIYTETAPEVFQHQLNDLLTRFQQTSNGMYYTSRVGTYLGGALATLNAALRGALTNQTPCDVTTYLTPSLIFASGVTYYILSLVNSNARTQADTLISLGINQGFFKSKPIISDIEEAKVGLSLTSTKDASKEHQDVIADAFRYRYLK